MEDIKFSSFFFFLLLYKNGTNIWRCTFNDFRSSAMDYSVIEYAFFNCWDVS